MLVGTGVIDIILGGNVDLTEELLGNVANDNSLLGNVDSNITLKGSR
jgi:hypothetical protein